MKVKINFSKLKGKEVAIIKGRVAAFGRSSKEAFDLAQKKFLYFLCPKKSCLSTVSCKIMEKSHLQHFFIAFDQKKHNVVFVPRSNSSFEKIIYNA